MFSKSTYRITRDAESMLLAITEPCTMDEADCGRASLSELEDETGAEGWRKVKDTVLVKVDTEKYCAGDEPIEVKHIQLWSAGCGNLTEMAFPVPMLRCLAIDGWMYDLYMHELHEVYVSQRENTTKKS